MPRLVEPIPKNEVNREGWLTIVASKIEPVFKGFNITPYRVTCGWPCAKALGTKSRVVGECHAVESSKAGVHEIFISPLLETPLDVSGTLCHEMAHVAAGIKAGHKGAFVKVCRHVGLTKGKPTSVMPGEALSDKLQKIIDKLGPYPHSSLVPMLKKVNTNPKTVHLECMECGCKITMTIKWAEEAGLPVCGCGGQMEVKVPGA